MKNRQKRTPDVVIHDQGTLVTFTPCTKRAQEWFSANVVTEPWQWLGLSLAVDPRCALDLADGIALEGLVIA